MRKPVVGNQDVHFVVNARTNKLKCFDSKGKMMWMIDARCLGTNGSYINHNGNTPPGLYKCGEPDRVLSWEKDSSSYGPWFVPLIEMEGQLTCYNRAGIGVHGGGSGLSDSYYSRKQGWVDTHGCIRLQNEDLSLFVTKVSWTRHYGGIAWLSVHW